MNSSPSQPVSERRFLFCHVPKSAGTTMGRILKKNFGEAFHPYYGLYDRYMFRAVDVELILEMYPKLRCIASHLFSLDLPFESTKFSIAAFSFVRHPVDRALSLYFYQIKLAKTTGSPHPGPLEDFFDAVYAPESFDHRFRNAQWDFLKGNLPEEKFDLSRVRAAVDSGRFLLAPMQRFDDACLLLERRYPEDFRDTSYPAPQNLAPRENSVPPRVLRLIEEHNELDLALFETAQTLFAREFDAVFGAEAEEARRGFSERCANLPNDWLEEDLHVELTKEERRLFHHLKRENAVLKQEIRMLSDIPVFEGGGILRKKHIATIMRRLLRKNSGDSAV